MGEEKKERIEEEWAAIFADFEYGEEEQENNEKMKEMKITLNKEIKIHYKDSYNYYNQILKAPKYWCAPMVGASELAFRMMVRTLGTELCTTPMIDAAGFVASSAYRKTIKFNHKDRPLIVQFAGNDPQVLVNATKLVEKYCDGVELNIGCPQQCAKRGFFGAFLMNEEKLLENIISKMNNECNVPVLCKTRIFTDPIKSVSFAKTLQDAGCSMITIHGRTRQQKRSGECLADWNQIKLIKESLQIPVFSNGNIRNFKDVEDCLLFTGCDGVMSALGILANPSIFQPSTSIRHYLLPRNDQSNNNDNNDNNNNNDLLIAAKLPRVADGDEGADDEDDGDENYQYNANNNSNNNSNNNIIVENNENDKRFLNYVENQITDDTQKIDKQYICSAFYYARMYLAYAKRFEANYLQIQKHLTSILRNEFRNFPDQSLFLISINENMIKEKGFAPFYAVINHLEEKYELHPPPSLSFFDDDHEYSDPDTFTID